MAVAVYEVVAGFLLLFVLPGLLVTKAVFPEWRVRGEERILRATEMGALTLTVSAALVILVGFGLENGTAAGFQATWGDPSLEAALAGVAVLAFAVGWWRGAYRKDPPAAPAREPAPGDEGGWELIRSLERLRREQRRVRHALRTAPAEGRAGLEAQLRELEAEEGRLRRSREEEYAR